MKTIYKNLALGMFLTVFAAAFAAPTFAQDACADVDANAALYKKYLDNYAGTLAQQKIAVEAGNEYIKKYEACMTVGKDAAGAETKTLTFADQITYFKENVPALAKDIKLREDVARDKPMYDKFKAGFLGKNVADIVSSGKEILSRYPDDKDSLDVAITIASAAFDDLLAKPTATVYKADLITYAKIAIDKIEAGKPSKSFGYKNYTLGTKVKALGALNYSIGLAMVNDPAMKKEAVGYFYKSSQYDSVFKNVPLLYQAIGSTYLDEFLRIDADRKKIIAENKGVDTPESLSLELMQKGYADRAIEAYARAYKNAKADKAAKKEYVDTLSTRLKELYAFRYDGKALDNVDTYAATVSSKTLTDPKAAVTPVKEEVPATTPAAGTTTPATTPMTPKPATTKPATTETGTATATTKPKAKKPAPKKKGTR